MEFSFIQRKIEKTSGRVATYSEQLETERKRNALLAEKLIAIDEAHAFLQKVAKETQEHLKYHIEDLVNLAIDTVFPDRYSFCIDFEIKRGQTEGHIFLLKDKHPIDPMGDSGGGIVDITAFALRIAAWTLGKTDNVILLDEPYRFISKDLQPLAVQILKTLSDKLKLQFVIVTHNKEIIDIADRVFEVTQKNGISKVKVLT
jgi:DNA repair exonuclease SbcCD ATPase subunit